MAKEYTLGKTKGLQENEVEVIISTEFPLRTRTRKRRVTIPKLEQQKTRLQQRIDELDEEIEHIRSEINKTKEK